MAKIQTESLVITFSKLVKDQNEAEQQNIIDSDMLEGITAVAEELVGAGVIVEIQTA